MPRPTILIIDENREEINLCEFILNAACRVIGATTGSEGLRLAELEEPELILIDPKLERSGEIQICRELIRSETTRNIPIVILGAVLDDPGEMDANHTGVVDYIAKPIIPAYFSKRVQTILEKYAGRINRCGDCCRPMQMDWKFCPYDGSPLPPLREKKNRKD